MLQSVATLLSLLIAGGVVALIAAMLLDNWRTVMRALRNIAEIPPLPLPPQGRPAATQDRARVIRVSSQSTPRRAAA